MSESGPEGAPAAARLSAAVVPAYSAVLTLLILAPLLAPGHLLLRDAVSTPRSYLTDAALGLGDAAPRAVPQDAALAVLSTTLDGGLVVKAILLLALCSAGLGAAVLARRLLDAPLSAQLVAVTVAIWNPYVAERLLQGHWSLLTGYAALPWTVLAALRLRDRHGTGRARLAAWAALALCLAAAGLTPTGALLAGVLALLTVGPRRIPGTALLWLGTAAPWLVAAALSGSAGEHSDPAGIAAFAARAEPWLGTLGALAGLGGIWNADAVPATRTGPLALIGTALLLLLVLFGLRRLLAAGPPDETALRRTLAGVAVAAVVLPALGATALGLAVGEQLVAAIPGAGLLRDTQKYVALAVPAYTLAAAAGAMAIARRAPAAVAALLIALLTLPLADLAFGASGALRPVHYPAGWARAAAAVDEAGHPGDIAVLPGGMFRRFPWSGEAPVLDPAPRLLPADVLQTGELPVRGGTVTGEGRRAARVERALLAGAPAAEIAGSGVGWVLVEHRTPGPLGDSARTLEQLGAPVYTDADLTLYRVPDPVVTERPSPNARRIAGATHLLWAALLIGGAAAAAALSRARNSPAPRSTR
ncbi:hypothetical protein [Nocardia sp. NPDC057227]|uniref:hypothetical protein n=1 Tax=Nocardia sp. NPDC057227 TaxID=3346056 RepID=UPI00362F95B2